MKQFFKNLLLTTQKYSLVVFFACFLCIIAIYTIETEKTTQNIVLSVNLILECAIFIPLFIGFYMFLKFESQKNNNVLRVFLVMVLFGLYTSLPQSEVGLTFTPYIRFAIFFLVFHVWVVIAPFYKNKNDVALWYYNKVLLVNFIFSLIVSFVIASGLNFGLIATKLLLNFDYNPNLHFEIVIVVFSIINTLLFLSKIPDNFSSEDNSELVSKTFYNVFKFVLIPLLGLYVLILVAYIFKIVIEWQLPQGIVVYLILGISIFGILCFLLVYPLVLENDYQWIKKAQKLYYILLLPLLLLLFIAIMLRINQYGITINRYIIFSLGIWLAWLVCAALFKWSLIKMIPMSLIVICVLSCIGPWGMFSVSEASQLKRLQSILEASQVLVKNKLSSEVMLDIKTMDASVLDSSIYRNCGKISDSNRFEAMSIIKYLVDFHGLKKIQPWFHQNLDSLNQQVKASKNTKDYTASQLVFMGMGLGEFLNEYNNKSDSVYEVVVKDEGNRVEDIKGYDERLELEFGNDDFIQNFSSAKDSIHVRFKDDALKVEIWIHNQNEISIDLRALFDKIIKENSTQSYIQLDVEDFTIKNQTKQFEAKLYMKRARVVKTDLGIKLKRWQGVLLLKRALLK